MFERPPHFALAAFLDHHAIPAVGALAAYDKIALQLRHAVVVALEQLAIGTTLLPAAFQIGFGAIGLALALAFGLGGREWAAGVIKKLTEK